MILIVNITKLEKSAFLMSAEKMISIKELARSAGVTARTLRHFESIGLLEPESRECGRVRHYPPEAAERLHMILRFKSVGFKLCEIKEIIDSGRVKGTGGDLALSMLEQLKARRKDIAQQIFEQNQLLDEINESIGVLEACLGCKAIPAPERCPRCKVVSSRDTVPGILSSINPNMPRGKRET